jgi:hypothetical protein
MHFSSSSSPLGYPSNSLYLRINTSFGTYSFSKKSNSLLHWEEVSWLRILKLSYSYSITMKSSVSCSFLLNLFDVEFPDNRCLEIIQSFQLLFIKGVECISETWRQKLTKSYHIISENCSNKPE